MAKRKIIGIIPARYGSKRLPGKPLIRIDGKPLVRRVYECAKKSSFLKHSFQISGLGRLVRREAPKINKAFTG